MTKPISGKWGQVDKEGALAVYSSSPYENTGALVDSPTPTTDASINIKKSTNAASNSAVGNFDKPNRILKNEFHYNDTGNQARNGTELETAATQYALKTSSTYLSYDTTNSNTTVNAETSQKSSKGALSWIPAKQHDALELEYAAASMMDIGNQNTCYDYSHINHEGFGGNIPGLQTPGRFSTIGYMHEASRGYADAETEDTSSSDTVQAYSGFESNFGIEPAPPPFIAPCMTEHVLPNNQLNVWLTQVSNASMPLSERLEKNNEA